VRRGKALISLKTSHEDCQQGCHWVSRDFRDKGFGRAMPVISFR